MEHIVRLVLKVNIVRQQERLLRVHVVTAALESIVQSQERVHVVTAPLESIVQPQEQPPPRRVLRVLL